MFLFGTFSMVFSIILKIIIYYVKLYNQNYARYSFFYFKTLVQNISHEHTDLRRKEKWWALKIYTYKIITKPEEMTSYVLNIVCWRQNISLEIEKTGLHHVFGWIKRGCERWNMLISYGTSRKCVSADCGKGLSDVI